MMPNWASNEVEEEYTLWTPLLQLTFNERPSAVTVVLFFVVGLVLTLGALYAYAVLLPDVIGFETTVLVGLGIIAMEVGE